MVLKITRWSTVKWHDDRFLHDPVSILFDSQHIQLYLSGVPSIVKQRVTNLSVDTTQYTEQLNFIKLGINSSSIKEVFSQITKSIDDVDYQQLRTNIKHSWTQWLEDMQVIWWQYFSKKHVLLYFLLISMSTSSHSFRDWVQDIKSSITDTIQVPQLPEQSKLLDPTISRSDLPPLSKITPKKPKFNDIEMKPTTIASVEMPETVKKEESIIYPETWATLIDSSGAVQNVLLPGIERSASGTTLCAKTTRKVQEKIYWESWFIVHEMFNGDLDAIWYHLFWVTTDIEELKLKYPLLSKIIEINKMDRHRKFVDPENLKKGFEDLEIWSNELWILTTTQSNKKVTDGHMVAVNNMYNLDGSVEGVYVYDPYLSKSIHKRHKRLNKNFQELYSLKKDNWYQFPINTYLAYCNYKSRIPLWITVYNQPSTPTHLITNNKVSDEINIKQSDLKQFVDLYPNVVQYIEANKHQLWDNFLSTTMIEDIANLGQESRLSPFAVNSRWFQWIWQMNNTALKEVYTKYPFIAQRFGNKTKVRQLNLEEMMLASKVYKNWVIYNQLCIAKKQLSWKSIIEVIDQNDAQKFVLAAYNRGSTRLARIVWKYIDATGKSSNISWDEFSDYYNLKISRKEINDNWYEELFGNDAENRVWYVEGINSIQRELEKAQTTILAYQPNSDMVASR